MLHFVLIMVLKTTRKTGSDFNRRNWDGIESKKYINWAVWNNDG